MGRMGKADFKQLKALQERIDQLSKPDLWWASFDHAKLKGGELSWIVLNY